MGPKKTPTTSRVSKATPTTPSSKSTSARARSLAGILTHDNFYLLWLCYSTSDQKPDYETIASKLGISRHAAHQRFYTLRNYFKAMEDGNGSQGADDTPTKTPRVPKTPKTPKTPSAKVEIDLVKEEDEESGNSDDSNDSKIKEEKVEDAFGHVDDLIFYKEESGTEKDWCDAEDDIH